MKRISRDNGWRLSDELWECMASSLPPPKPHSLGCHRPRIPNRMAMDAILLVLRTDMQWNALDQTGICTCSAAYRRFRKWIDAGVFEVSWRNGLSQCEALSNIDWDWLALDGTMTKAPLGGKKTGPNPTDRGIGGVKRSLLTQGSGMPLAVVAAPTNRHDMKLVAETLASFILQARDAGQWRRLYIDLGYNYQAVRNRVSSAHMVTCMPAWHRERLRKRHDGTPPQRWLVERTHSWLNCFRRLLIRWKKRVDTYLTMLQFVCGLIVWRFALSK